MANKADTVWFHTHSDFKAVIDGVRYVLVTTNGKLGFSSIDAMSDEELTGRLPKKAA